MDASEQQQPSSRGHTLHTRSCTRYLNGGVTYASSSVAPNLCLPGGPRLAALTTVRSEMTKRAPIPCTPERGLGHRWMIAPSGQGRYSAAVCWFCGATRVFSNLTDDALSSGFNGSVRRLPGQGRR